MMTARVEIVAGWTGEGFVPLRRFQKTCDSTLVIGERYVLTAELPRSVATHRHYFAALNDLFASWPENHERQFASMDHMRRWALIRTGWRNERRFAADSEAQALRFAAFLREADEYAEFAVNDSIVVEWRAKSQNHQSMGKEEFAKSKADVLAFLSEEIGTTVAALTHHSSGSSGVLPDDRAARDREPGEEHGPASPGDNLPWRRP